MAEDRFIKDDRINEVEGVVADLRTNWSDLCAPSITDNKDPSGRNPAVDNFTFRKNQLIRMKDWIHANEQLAFDAFGSDLGLSDADTYASGVVHMCNVISKVIQEMGTWVKPQAFESNHLNSGTSGYCVTQGRGVYCIFGSWNVPMLVTLSPLAYAIAAGNCVVVKPSELSPACSNYMNRLMRECLDSRFYHCIEGAIHTGIKLNSTPFDGFVFTGGTWVGKIIGGACGKNGTHTI